jgi:hypothetical protein
MGERALLIAWTLSLASRWRRLREQARTHRALSFVLVLTVIAVAVLMSTAAQSRMIRDALTWLTLNTPFVGLSTALYMLLFVARRRSELQAERASSWMTAAPIPNRAFARLAAMRLTLSVVAHTLIILIIGLVAAIANRDADIDCSGVLSAMLIGIVTGAIVGSVWSIKPSARSEESRFVSKTRNVQMQPSLAGLARWPIAKAIAWHRPENARVLFIVAALSVPVGTSALLGMAILATWTLGSYLFAVARAVPNVAREAAIWLRPTPLPFSAFAWALMRRALVHQFIGTLALGAIAMMVGGQLASVVYLGSLWLSIAVMIALIGIQCSYRALPAAGRTWLSLLLVIAAESRARGWGLPVSTLLTVAQVWGVSRARS